MLVRNLALLFLSAGLMPGADLQTLTPKLEQLPPADFNQLLMKSLPENNRPQPGALGALPAASSVNSGNCAIRLREYRVHDTDSAASLRIPPQAFKQDKIGIAPPVPACPR